MAQSNPKSRVLEHDTLPKLLMARVVRNAGHDVLWEQNSSGQWLGIGWEDFLKKVQSLSVFLREKGVGEGDVVGIIAGSSINWEIAQQAVAAAGAITVGLDPFGLDASIRESAEMAGVSAVFAESET